jgi:hypothetical protein
VRRGDRESTGAIADEYVAYMTRVVAYYEQQSIALFGREIPQVLLIHASALNAGAFDALAIALKNRGYRFVPLDRVLADPAYASPDQYAGPSGITWIHRWAITAGRPRTSFAGEPDVPEWIQRAAVNR